MTKVNIQRGLHYSTDLSGIFDLAEGYKPDPASRRDGFIWIMRDGKRSRLAINEGDFTILGEESDLVSEEVLAENIDKRFRVLDMIMNGILHNKIKAAVFSGAPGIGKTFNVDQRLTEARRKHGREVKHLTGSATAIGLYCKLYENRNPGNILVLDDLDSIFSDQEALNLLKGALDTGATTRTISWMAASSHLESQDIPNEFEFEGSVIFISNLDFDGQIEKGSKLAPHLRALVNRCVYLDLGIHTTREIMVRVKQVIEKTTIIEDLGLADNHSQDIIAWMEKNCGNLRDLSIRTIIHLANFVRTDPHNWQDIAEITMVRR